MNEIDLSDHDSRVVEAVIQNGVIVPLSPLPWNEGTKLQVKLTDDPLGILGSDPESIARWMAYDDSCPPLTISDEEWERMQQVRREDREWQLAHAEERHQRLFGHLK